ncbi:hypothetical protein [Mucilaginibacter kameinonensis]|uniref:hypothetical protein n=1 Tax=Mucilaginibacter kameinonensis TaxID=452286 RepID=UPI0013CE63ED|nr:hypothetical protein [Mucilaginibacter kameinonensis]
MNEKQQDDIYRLNEEEIESVKDGICQIENGLCLSKEEADAMIDKCLEKRSTN